MRSRAAALSARVAWKTLVADGDLDPHGVLLAVGLGRWSRVVLGLAAGVSWAVGVRVPARATAGSGQPGGCGRATISSVRERGVDGIGVACVPGGVRR